MMLNMASTSSSSTNQFERGYQRSRSSVSCSGDLVSSSSSSKNERESIHSGQFMVSHFEAEEAQDDLDDSEVKMLDPEDPSLSKPDESNPCMEVQLYVPRNCVKQQHEFGNLSQGHVTSHLEIETSLTKLFKCMTLAYSQKLTSPKWNHFKGVRLRWKDKIRLNNVIWRCWHMQFILKRKTPVCQFASPLDVDIHSNPQSVVLEGKYWKRQLQVIKAEYRKWRRNFKTKAIGCLTYDTKSELDFIEWSPNLLLNEDWTSDTLFSAINGPFPFPDPREIARGAGIADFIQPSLGPLQPNLDDIDLSFSEFFPNSRLPPVPEEGTEDMLKIDYGFSAIMGSEQMDSSSIMEVSASGSGGNSSGVVVNAMSSNEDANMLELNTPLNTMQFADIEQQFATRGTSSNGGASGGGVGRSDTTSGNVSLMNTSQRGATGNNAASMVAADDPMITEDRAQVAQSVLLTPEAAVATQNNQQRGQMKHFGGGVESTLSRQNSNDFSSKSVIKGRISKNSQRPFRREPHNYDKAQPTLHQTTIYQQMLAEQQQKNQQQQQQQQLQQSSQLNQNLHANLAANAFQAQVQQQQQQQQQLQYTPSQYAQSGAGVGSGEGGGGGGSNNSQYSYNIDASAPLRQTNLSSNNLLGMPATQTTTKGFNLPTSTTAQTCGTAASQGMLLNVKIEPLSTDMLSMFNMGGNQGANDVYSNITYKPYANSTSFKKSASTGTYINMRSSATVTGSGGGGSGGITQSYMQQEQMQSPQMHTQSLPLSGLGSHNQMAASFQQQQQQQHRQQQQQQQHQQQQLTQNQISPNTSSQQASQSQQQQSLQHTQAVVVTTQQQQQQQQQQVILPKEMFRSNSLPLNVSLQKLDTARLGHENFAMPKYHPKNHKTRSRSNSIHQHMLAANASVPPNANSNTAGAGNTCGSSNLLISHQLQSATSDPMLNSTLAQLLTTNTRMPSLSKQQSSSTSAISNLTMPSVPPPTLPASSGGSGGGGSGALSLSKTGVNQGLNLMQQGLPATASAAAAAAAALFLSPAQSNPATASLVSSFGGATANSQELLQRQQQQQQQQQQQVLIQQQQQHHHQQKSPKKSASLPTPISPITLHSPPGNKTLSYPLTQSGQSSSAATAAAAAAACTSTTHLSLSPDSFHDQDSPLSPTHSLNKFPRDNQRRAGHIHAEQKRRYNIKNGFDMLHSLIPQLQQNPNAKLSKAAMLQKGAEHIKHLRTERNVLKDKMESLRKERDALQNSLTHLHSILPANGAPVTRQGTEHVRQLYEHYVRYRTMDNWKFWILGLILEPLLSSYTSSVSSASLEELRRTAFLWVDQHCSLIDLRPAVSNKLKYLSMKTDILSDPPSTLQEEVAKAVNNTAGQHPNLHGT